MQGSSIGCFSRCKSESCYVNVLFMDYTKCLGRDPIGLYLIYNDLHKLQITCF
uniref:Uncharacterized protein n=1 Tax=Anguilla anguilla TaxID=7936 RepID=A0A0E9SCA0_ANGAN